MSANPLYKDVEGAPVKIGQIVKILEQSDEEGYPELVGEIGVVHHLEYECGCGQEYPHSPMIGVKFDKGIVAEGYEVKEFWFEELEIQTTITIYHVFTHNMDGFVLSYKRAKELYDEWLKDYEDVRLYKEVYSSQEEFEDGMNCEEDCILSNGNYPW